MNNYTDESLRTLNKQLKSFKSLTISLERALSIQDKAIKELEEKLALRSDDEILALRETNERLTNQVEELETALRRRNLEQQAEGVDRAIESVGLAISDYKLFSDELRNQAEELG